MLPRHAIMLMPLVFASAAADAMQRRLMPTMERFRLIWR